MSEPFQALPRCFKVAYLQPKDLFNCLTLNASVPRDTLVKISLGGVPPGTRVVGRYYDMERYAECLTLYHESWPEVPPYQIPEEIEVTRTFVEVRGSVPRSEEETGHPMVAVETEDSGTNNVLILDRNGALLREHTIHYTGTIRNMDGYRSYHKVTYEEPILVRSGETLLITEMSPSKIGYNIRLDVSPDNTTQPDNCLTVGFLDENRDKIKEVSIPYATQLNGVPAETNQNNAYESYGKVTDTTSFLDDYEDTIQKMAIPALIRLNEVTSEPKASWRDRPSLL